MSLLDWFKDQIKHPSRKYISTTLEPSHVDVSTPVTELEGGKHYFRLWLTEMCLKNDRQWFQAWHPAVNSIISFEFGSNIVEIPHIAGALKLPDFKENNLEKVIHMSYPMTTLMPFNGGVVKVSAGLLAMKGENFVNSFIKVMSDFSSLLVVPQLSAALKIAGPVASGIQTLLGAGADGRLELGLNQSFSGKGGGGSNDLKSGYLAVIAAEETKTDEKNKIDVDKLWIVKDQLRYGNTKTDNQPLAGYTYMLFRIESRIERDDWSSLSSIAEPFDKAVGALGEAEMEKADSFLRTAIVTALQSHDLTKADRTRVIQAMKEAFDQAKKDIGLGGVPAGPVTLDNVMLKAIDVDSALNESAPTLEQLFAS